MLYHNGRPLFRFSLLEAWWKNPTEAMARYFPEDAPKHTNKYMEFGTKVANALAERPVPDWVADIPRYELSEYESILPVGNVYVRGSIDNFDPNRLKFLDNKCALVKPLKTGGWSAHSWTQEKVNKHDQLVVYSTMLQKEFGWVDDECHISVVPYFEDKFEKFKRVPDLNLHDPKYLIPRIITQAERDMMWERIVRTSEEIHKKYEMWLQMNPQKPKVYIFTKEIKKWGVEAGDYYNEQRHIIVGGTQKLLADGVIEDIHEDDYQKLEAIMSNL